MKLILACDPSGGIGYKNKLPWSNIQGDLPRFKRLTEGKPVIMGRNTWDSLPKKPLPGRINIVVTSRPLEAEYDNVIRASELNNWNRPDDVEFWLIGGAKLVQGYWHQIDEVHLTKVYDHYTCDTFVNLILLEQDFEQTYNEVFPDHQYQIWKRK